MRDRRNKHGSTFIVAILSGGKQTVKESDDADDAYSLAYGNPHVVVEKFDETGGNEDSYHFTPKHPLWSRGDFLKWARSRGRRASRMIRQRIVRG